MPITDEEVIQKFPKFSEFSPELKQRLIDITKEKFPTIVDDSAIVNMISEHVMTTGYYFINKKLPS